MRRGVGNFPRGLLRRALKTELEMIEARANKRREFRFIERQAAGDQTDVQPGLTGGVDEFDDVGSRERFTASEVHLQNTQLDGFPKQTNPRLRGKFRIPFHHF